MSLGMLLAQPRHVVAKLNGLNSAEECNVFRSVGPACSNGQGEPCYTVAAVRIETQSYRHQVTLGSLLEHAVRTETVIQEVRDEQRGQKELLVGMGEQISHVRENDKHTRNKLDLLWNGLAKGSGKGKGKGATPAQVGKVAGGWSAQRVRRYARKGWFEKSRLHHLKNGRWAFNPNKVEEDIADIKERLQKGPGKGSGKGRRKNP
jgi:hypothetical protein